MKPKKQPSDPWAYLMLLLRYRPRSVAEARQRMVEQGYAAAAIQDTIDQAIATNLLDDAAFAKLWIRDRMWHHPLSRAAISQELRQKGVASDIIAATLQAEYPAVKELELARGLAESRVSNGRAIDPDKRMNRLVGLLARRGFSRSVAFQVVSALEKEMAPDVQD